MLRSRLGLKTPRAVHLTQKFDPALPEVIPARKITHFHHTVAREILRKIEAIEWKMKALTLIALQLALIAALLYVVDAYIGATVAVTGLLIPTLMLLTRYDKRKSLIRQLEGLRE